MRIRGFRLAQERDAADADEFDAAAAPVSRVGADLRGARERLGWTLEDVSAHLRIRLPYLAAIEAGRLNELPGNAYAVGFIRAYARSMGLDAEEIARRFRAEAADMNVRPELTFPAPVPERGVPAGALILLGVVLVVGAYVGWYRLSGSSRPAAEQVAEVPARLAPLAEPRPAPGEASAPATPTGPDAALAAPVPPPRPAPQAAAPSLPVFGPPAPTAEAAPEGTRIVLRAKQDAWMQVRERQGAVLLNRVLRAGETWPVPPPRDASKPPLLLTTGNAGRTELLIDGALAPQLGIDGMIRRDVPLDPDALRNPPPPRR